MILWPFLSGEFIYDNTEFVCVTPFKTVFSGLISAQNVTSLFLVPVLSLGPVLTVTAEMLLADYRYIRTGGSLTDRLANRPMYTIVRTVEIFFTFLSVGVFSIIIGPLPDGPMSGPGAIGLLLIMVGLGLLILGGSLVRTLTEYSYHRHNSAA